MAFVLHPFHTDKRQRWLETLLETPGKNRAGTGVVAFQCMRLGWTDWNDDMTGECLTENGLAKLREWQGRVPNA